MTFQYIKSSNSLKQKAEMEEPKFIPPLTNSPQLMRDAQETADRRRKLYKQVLDSLKEYPVIGSGWDEKKDYVEGKDFEIGEHRDYVSLVAHLTPSKEEGEEVIYNEVWGKIVDILYDDKPERPATKIVEYLKQSFSITRKQ